LHKNISRVGLISDSFKQPNGFEFATKERKTTADTIVAFAAEAIGSIGRYSVITPLPAAIRKD